MTLKDTSLTPAPTYGITPSSSSINEGATLTTTIATTNLAAGTTLYWSVGGTGINASDFSSGALTGSGAVGPDGTFSFAHTASNDLTTEGDETLQIKLFSDSARTVQVGSTASVTLKDNQKNSPPTGIPILLGTFKSGSTISIDNTPIQDADNFSGFLPAFTYSWEVLADGTTWTKLVSPDATDNNSTFTLTDAEVGKKIRGTVSYLDGNANNEVASTEGRGLISSPSWFYKENIGSHGLARDNNGHYYSIDSSNGEAVEIFDIGRFTPLKSINGNWREYRIIAVDRVDGVNQVAFHRHGSNMAHLWICGDGWVKLGSTDVSITQARQIFGTHLDNVFNFVPTGTPSLSGITKVGRVLTADKNTIADPDGVPISVFYGWEVSTNGTTWTKLTSVDATDNNSTYTLTAAEMGKSVRSVISYTDGFGTNEVAHSAATTAVIANAKPTNIRLSRTRIRENIGANVSVATVSSVDLDLDDAHAHTLVVGKGSTDNSRFSIADDQLYISDNPDFEAKNSYSIRVRTTDLAGLFVEKIFALKITNVNESPTDISITGIGIDEGVAVGSIVGSLLSTDEDETSSIFSYALVAGTNANDNDKFEIVGDQLKSKAIFDFESKSSYRVHVRTTDEAGLAFTKLLMIKVNNVNESPTDLTVSTTAFNENVPIGTIVAALGCSDPDKNGAFSYSLVAGDGDRDNQVFLISGNSIKVNVATNFEIQKFYSVRLRVTDQGGLFFEKAVVLGVNNIVERISSAVSTTLAPDLDTLKLTGTKNIFAIGNSFDNTLIGNSGRNYLTGGLGKDILTGGAGVDTFVYNELKESVLSGFDVITDYTAGEKVAVGFNFGGGDLIASTGKISDLNADAIALVLSGTTFLANNAAGFMVEGFTGTFLALNDGRDGFQADSDALIHLSQYIIGSSTPVSII